MEKIKYFLIAVILFAISWISYMVFRYNELSEYKFLEKYCENVTFELLRMNRSCDCVPAKINNSYGCICGCDIGGRTVNIFLKVVG